MDFSKAVLIEPTDKLKAEFRSMAEEFYAEGDRRFELGREDFAAYLEQLESFKRSEKLPPGRVPQNSFWLVKDDRLIGVSSLRRYLNDALEKEGGHIGYSIRPSERRKGFGTLILKLTLEKAANLGLRRVLVTCDADNTGSAKIIEKNGGRLFESGVSERSGKQISRYRLEIE